MTKADVVRRLKNKADLASLVQAEAAYEGLVEILTEALKREGSVAITDFGSFTVVGRKARKGRNPRTGAEIRIPAKKAIKFAPSKALKENF